MLKLGGLAVELRKQAAGPKMVGDFARTIGSPSASLMSKSLKGHKALGGIPRVASPSLKPLRVDSRVAGAPV